MIRSMTGFGSATVEKNGRNYRIIISCVNNRFCEVFTHFHHSVEIFERQIVEMIRRCFQRGKIDVTINARVSDVEYTLTINEKLLKRYVHHLRALAKKNDLISDISVTDIIHMKGIVQLEDNALSDNDWSVIQKGIARAINGVEKMRKREGTAIARDVNKIINKLKSGISVIKKKMPKINKAYELRLHEKMKQLIGKGYDEQRIITESAIMAAKTDINEEIMRFSSHFDQISGCLKEKTPVGKKMDFLVQEMLREANTIGSKVGDISVTREVVELKSNIEKLKEHVRNIQ